jgi:hypothetical protein
MTEQDVEVAIARHERMMQDRSERLDLDPVYDYVERPDFVRPLRIVPPGRVCSARLP